VEADNDYSNENETLKRLYDYTEAHKNYRDESQHVEANND
jgi:hypothetical protein